MLIAFMLFAVLVPQSFAQAPMQRVKDTTFWNAEQVMKLAENEQADLLASIHFKAGWEAYKKAEKAFDDNKSIGEIREHTRNARVHFTEAYESAVIAREVLDYPMKARRYAEWAGAPSHATALWVKAGNKFAEATKTVEEGSLTDARTLGMEAAVLYRNAELKAIRITYLQEAYDKVRQAEAMGAADTAPRTLKRAKALIADTEKELEDGPYDADMARHVALEARDEANHAIYLTDKLNTMDADEESLFLVGESHLQRIAWNLDMKPDFQRGMAPVASNIIDRVQALQDSTMHLTSLIYILDTQNNYLYARIAELGTMVIGIPEINGGKNSLLARRIGGYKAFRNKFSQIENLFDWDEGHILTDGERVILRLSGINFEVGEATLDGRNDTILHKVGQAIAQFPQSHIVVQGHTDYLGSDETNWTLSNTRAESVRQFLIGQLNIDGDRISAFGYGENRPVANNDTPDGRRKNRRTDIIIIPNFDMMSIK